MPYAIRKEGSRYIVEKKNGRRRFGTHPNKASAERQMRALYASDKTGKKTRQRKK